MGLLVIYTSIHQLARTLNMIIFNCILIEKNLGHSYIVLIINFRQPEEISVDCQILIVLICGLCEFYFWRSFKRLDNTHYLFL